MAATDIVIKGAREHNLRDVDLALPRNRLICFTGVSGSGKSSLAFDTLYAEGQRRYVESLSSFARQFLGQMPKPDVDLISGLSPSISISQKSAGMNPRSTVGTITEIYDYLRVLYARVGKGHCPQCGRAITAQTRQEIIERIASLPPGTHFLVLAPMIRGQKGEYRDLFVDLLKQGFVRARVDGSVVRLTDELRLDRQMRHNIEVVVDRLVAGQAIHARLAEAVELALKIGEGSLIVAREPGGQPPGEADGSRGRGSSKRAGVAAGADGGAAGAASDIHLSADYACTHCRLSFEPPSPQLFSFNSPQGMCPTCSGLGEIYGFVPELLVPSPSKSFQQGAIELFGAWKEMGAGGGTSTGAWPRPWSANLAWSPARCWRPPGKSLMRRSARSCSGAPATSTSPSPGARGPRATSGAASSRGSSPSCSPNIAPLAAACSGGCWRST